MLLFAVRISRHAGGVFEVELPMLHRCWPFKWLGHSGKARSDASVFRSRAGEPCGSISAAAALLRLPPDLSNRGWPLDPVGGPALLGDHPGSLKADQLLGSRVWEADDEGHGRAHTAPAHHRVAHSRGVSSICRPSSLTSPWPGPIDHASNWDTQSSSAEDWLGLRSRLLP